ncbi:hypothetical protein H5V44_10000 [Halobellus sp. MBLA0160]|uniref:Uncharacterized protein n=1 Tax=Halobellus ruber TaxID=2761102 RepID=A0A7J9SJ98_9EURY|nr:hypothetical protein [Halobellus ruber]
MVDYYINEVKTGTLAILAELITDQNAGPVLLKALVESLDASDAWLSLLLNFIYTYVTSGWTIYRSEAIKA